MLTNREDPQEKAATLSLIRHVKCGQQVRLVFLDSPVFPPLYPPFLLARASLSSFPFSVPLVLSCDVSLSCQIFRRFLFSLFPLITLSPTPYSSFYLYLEPSTVPVLPSLACSLFDSSPRYYNLKDTVFLISLIASSFVLAETC